VLVDRGSTGLNPAIAVVATGGETGKTTKYYSQDTRCLLDSFVSHFSVLVLYLFWCACALNVAYESIFFNRIVYALRVLTQNLVTGCHYLVTTCQL
jgi:hypothetical protein